MNPPAIDIDDDTETALQKIVNKDRNNPRLFRQEMSIKDCVVDGEIPSDLNGRFYRVGPDPQYPLAPGNIPFDGDGHASVFRISNGRVDFLSRYVQTERYLAQDAARRPLFHMYRNPAMDDPAVKGLSRSTANTHIVTFGDRLLALKEDSPPSLLDPDTLETLDHTYTFDGTLPSQTFTAHPKFDPHTGNMVAFGFESDGDRSDTISVFEYDVDGNLIWDAKLTQPYISMVHDFGVTENFIVFFLNPLMLDEDQLARGGIRWSWNPDESSYVGCMRRGGDGSDLQWITTPARAHLHSVGSFDDGQTVYFDLAMSAASALPFIPHRTGGWTPETATCRIHRLSMNMAGPTATDLKIELLHTVVGELPRQDDRYNTVAYRYGFQASPDLSQPNIWKLTNYVRLDNQTKQAQRYEAPPNVTLSEPVFAPKNAAAAEGEGYLLGMGTHVDKGGLADLIILDAERLADGPICTVTMPGPVAPQIHGWWAPE